MIAKMSAMIPRTPSETPNPIPAFIPTDIPSSVEGLTAVKDVGDGVPSKPDVDKTDGEGVEVDGADPVWPDVGVADELCAVVEISRAMLNPTTAIAPTLEEADMVVVVIVQSFGDM
jgi:hypothetical protein